MRVAWHRWENAPTKIKMYLPAKPELGEHRFKTETMENTNVLIVCFENTGKPLFWAVINHPEIVT